MMRKKLVVSKTYMDEASGCIDSILSTKFFTSCKWNGFFHCSMDTKGRKVPLRLTPPINYNIGCYRVVLKGRVCKDMSIGLRK